MSRVALRDNERVDDLQIRGYRIIQKTDGFCFGMDAVLLSDYAQVRRGDRVIDLCSGTGIVPVLVCAKYEPSHIEAVEYLKEYVEMTKRTLILNGITDRITVRQGDIREIRDAFPRESFDHVTCNPPYMPGKHGLVSGNEAKAAARHEILCTFQDVAGAAQWLLKPGGHVTIVHRPFRLAEIFSCLKEHRLEPKRMRLVYPYVDREPNMVLIDAAMGGRERITVDPPLIVYNKDGSYTDEIYRIYGAMI